MVEKAIKDKPTRTRDADEIYALRKRNLELEQENESLTARLEKTKAKEVEALLEKAKGPIYTSRGRGQEERLVAILAITGADDASL